MLEPTQALFELAEGKDVRYTFFVDVGYFVQAERVPELAEEVERAKQQVKEMVSRGHDVQLHIHPHWEISTWREGTWHFRTREGYKLSDFPDEQRAAIVRKYKAYLESLIGRKVEAFRAGGWCIQPFSGLRDVFLEEGIKIDSTVIPGDYLQTDTYAVDFREAPRASIYRFDSDVLVEEDGPFTEYPIGSLRYSPLFFWRLYVLGRLFPAKHKMVGDGLFLSQGGRKKHVLTSYTSGHVSSDGYFAGKLEAALDKYENLKFEELVVIGHPKGNTQYSIKKMQAFINKYHKKHAFVSFQQVL